MLHIPLTIYDMEDIDQQIFKSLKFLTKNDITDEDLFLTFSHETHQFGQMVKKDLIPNGRNIEVTEKNKFEFIKAICYEKMGKGIKAQTENFLKGFYELVPRKLISIFNPRELELLISGLPTIKSTPPNPNPQSPI
jgi:E3 ubiquitin-protein ligase HUWE1